MQTFKIDNFKKEKPGHAFPRFESLGVKETEAVRADLASRLGLPQTVDPLELIRCVGQRARVLRDVDADEASFDIAEALRVEGIRPRPDVYVNWYRFDEIDRMRFDDLAQNFDDVWYPTSDDIDIFDSSFSWILSIDHEGTVKLLRLAEKQET